jgi:fructose-bisphosphate aldolase class 1
MNDRITKRHVRSDFTYARAMMRLADEAMRTNSGNFDEMEQIANEMIACASTFAQYVEEQREAQS